jgi:hypothetical protein
MSLGLRIDPGYIETGNLRTEDRLDALASALADCTCAGEALALEADWVTRSWQRRAPTYTAAAFRMCEARRAELAAEAAQARGGATAASLEV